MTAINVPQALELALQHHRSGRLPEAETIYREILAAEPNHPSALHFLGVVAHQTGRHGQAIEWIGRAVALDPKNPAAHSNLGEAYRATGQLDEASTAYRRALALKPGYTQALNNLGAVFTEQGRLEEALETLHRALTSDPRCAEAYSNLGNTLAELGRLDEAITAFERALVFQPDHANARFGQSLVRLLKGDFERGWPLYEARRIVHHQAERHFPRPMWDGSPLSGQRVLVHTEQGFGDAIQFVRYATLIARRGGEVIVECPRVLKELFRTAKDVREVVPAGEPLPAFDFHVPILSQPLVFRTAADSIPREVPYLFADRAQHEAWQHRLAPSGTRLKVGLAWAGNPANLPLRKRHISPDQLAPLLHAAHADFFSLQVGGATAAVPPRTPTTMIRDITEHLHDFADTAALMAELDLIISVDTAAAHLAGALGRPVWTLLPCVPDWRWGLETEETPWYPTMRLFRQRSPGEWGSVVRRVAEELKSFHPIKG
jgi:Flp pilus assembly protein TadD